MTINRHFLLNLTLCVVLTAISGCTSIGTKFRPEHVEWARAQGKATLTVRGYMTGTSKIKIPCNTSPAKAILMPDDPYYRGWIRAMNSFHISFPATLSTKAEALLRQSPWTGRCIFTFKNVPPGPWLVMITMHETIVREIHSTGFGGSVSFPAVIPDLAYAPLTITSSDTVIRKNIVMDYSKRTDIGLFKFRKRATLSDVEEWTPPEKTPITPPRQSPFHSSQSLFNGR